ncbi:MAG: hypothetical protein ACPGNP_12635 [Acidimicrobiales bacterium]
MIAWWVLRGMDASKMPSLDETEQAEVWKLVTRYGKATTTVGFVGGLIFGGVIGVVL